MAGPQVASRTLHPAPPESYTVFTAGCNFKCLGCQNWTISQFPDNRAVIDGFMDPAVLAQESVANIGSKMGRLMAADRIFFSGGEPTIHLPYIETVVREARRIDPGTRVNFDTNGYLTEDSLARVLGFTTSITFDIKAISEETMSALTGARVEPVLRNAGIVAKSAPEKLWEFRIVAIPGMNEDDIEPICRFIASLDKGLPVAFLAFRPNWVLDECPGASRELMNECVEMARAAGLENVSISGVTNIPGNTGEVAAEIEEAYRSSGARLAASHARAKGCKTHPRDCVSCESRDACPLKRYIPKRSC